MHKSVLAIAFAALTGCQTGSQGTIRSASDYPAEMRAVGAPPVEPKCEVAPLPDYATRRRCLAYDLNGDGTDEYFVEYMAGAHGMTFVLIDAAGNSLLRACDSGQLGGDRLVILNCQHDGYRDIIESDCDMDGLYERRWTFNGRWYVPTRVRRYSNDQIPSINVEHQPGASAARWYADGWAKSKME